MDLDELLRTSASVPDPAPRVLRAGHAALDAEILAARTRIDAARSARRRRTRRVGITALTATAAAAALVIAPSLGLGSGPTATAQAAEVLREAGAAAGAQPGGWPDATYWHSTSTYRDGSGATYTREIWIGHHETGALRDQGLGDATIALGTGGFPAGGRSLSWDELYALPTAPDALENVLRHGINGAGPDDDSELFTIVGDLLRESPAPPALRQALWEVAAHIPGVTLVGPVTDSAGRPGTAVQRDNHRYVLDPDNGSLLEESTGGDAGWRSTYLEQGPADTAPAATAVAPEAKTG